MPVDWPAFVEIVQKHQRFLLTCHQRPDCDALGSELGLAGMLDALGKEVRIVNPHPTPPNLAFIDPQRRIEAIGVDVQVAELFDVADVLIILDTSSWAQLGDMGEVVRATNAVRVVIDHHIKGDDVGALEFKNTSAEAAGRLVAEVAEHLEVTITPEIATSLFAAIATDTGWFRFNSTTPETYDWASKLTAAGASPADIFEKLYEQDSLGRIKLRGRILERFETRCNGRLAYTHVRNVDFEETGALASDTEDVINMGLAIAGTDAAVILVEQPQGGFKISFRSRCKMDCSEVAAQFGGGGHKAAAGAFINEPFEQAQSKVLAAVEAAM